MKERRSRPAPPRPDQVRSPPRQFAMIDRRLLLERRIEWVKPEAFAVYAFLCLAADGRGVSWYRRETIVERTGLSWDAIGQALDRLEELGWIAFEPWRPDRVDGVYQVLDLPGDDSGAIDEETIRRAIVEELRRQASQATDMVPIAHVRRALSGLCARQVFDDVCFALSRDRVVRLDKLSDPSRWPAADRNEGISHPVRGWLFWISPYE